MHFLKDTKSAFVTFFPIYPNNMGSSTVVNSRFQNWPSQKKIFQLSHLKIINNKYFKTVSIKKENSINKLLKLPELAFHIFQYLKDSKKKILLLEGASWIGFTFIIFILIKTLLPKTQIIYISHGIESEIRKKYSNIIIFYLTKLLEEFIFRFSNLSTCVSKRDQKNLGKIYNINVQILPNGIDLKRIKKKKYLKHNYIIYSGSYLYKPNKEAINYLNERLMPLLIKKYPNLKLVITGGGYQKKFPWLINMGIVSKKKLLSLTYFSECLCVPLFFGYGTRIKILEALSIGAVIVSTKKGIEGIDLKDKIYPIVVKDVKNLPDQIIRIIKNNKFYKNKALKMREYYLKKYSMKNILNKFIYENKI